MTAAFEELQAAYAVRVHVREMDILIDTDLADTQTQLEVLQEVRDGQYIFIIASPPCETWSRACWRPGSGPRPVRSFEHPLGFPWLSDALRSRADAGTALVLFTFLCFFFFLLLEPNMVSRSKASMLQRTELN